MAFEFDDGDRDDWADQVTEATLSAAELVRRRMARRLARRPSIPASPAAVFKPAWWDEALDDRVAPTLTSVATSAADSMSAGLGVELDESARNGMVGAAVAATIVGLSSRGDVVAGRVAELVERGRADGWGPDRLAAELGVGRDADGGPLSEALLAGFAGGAANALTGRVAHDTLTSAGMVGVKTWNAVGDDSTREEHDDLDGVSVPLDEPFDMAGYEAMYPGDDALPPELSVMCRCWLTYDAEPATAADVEVGVDDVTLSTTESGEPPTLADQRAKETTVPTNVWHNLSGDPWVARATAAFQSRDGIIVTVEPSPGQKAALAVESGLPPSMLHVTLATLPVDPGDTTARQVVSSVLASIAEQTGELAGEVSGLGWFGDPTAMTLALVDAPGLAELRTLIVSALMDAGYPPDETHDFQPHITLADTGVDAARNVGAPLTFTELRLRWQVETLAFDLVGPINPGPEPQLEAEPAPPAEVPPPAPQEAPVPTATQAPGAFAPADQVPPPPPAPVDPGGDVAPAPEPDPALTDMSDDELIAELARRALVAANGDAEDLPDAVEEITEAFKDTINDINADEVDEGEVPPDGAPPSPDMAVAADASPVAVPTDAPGDAPDVELPAEPPARPYDWEGVLTVEGTPSGDGRIIAEGALTWRDLPLPFMLMTTNAPGHDGSVVCGSIVEIERVGSSIVGRGYFSESDAGQQAKMLLVEGTLRGVSVDIDSVIAVLADSDGNIIDETSDVDPYTVDLIEMMIEGRVMGATFCPFPAFQEAAIHPFDGALVASAVELVGTVWRASSNQPLGVAGEGTHAAVVASAAATADGAAPSRALFALRPDESSEPFGVLAPLADGTVPCYGLVARWGQCHIGESRRCLSVPKSTDFRSFYTGKKVLTREGDMMSVGQVIMDTVHPNLLMHASDAQAFYAHTGCAVADVRLYATDEGIVAAGVIRPGVDPVTVRRLRASDISPDWRRINGEHKLVALLAVNTSGFLVEGIAASAGQFRTWALVDTHGRVDAIVAAGAIRRSARESLADQVDALRAEVEQLRAMVTPPAPDVDVDAELASRAEAALAAFGSPADCEDCLAAA